MEDVVQIYTGKTFLPTRLIVVNAASQIIPGFSGVRVSPDMVTVADFGYPV